MPLLSGELYDALLDAGASEEKARKAAEAVAWPNREIQELRSEVATLRAEVRADLAGIKATLEHLQHRLTTLNWTIGVIASLGFGLLILALNWLWQIMQRVH